MRILALLLAITFMQPAHAAKVAEIRVSVCIPLVKQFVIAGNNVQVRTNLKQWQLTALSPVASQVICDGTTYDLVPGVETTITSGSGGISNHTVERESCTTLKLL